MGSTQVKELGEIETPILLTSTLNVPRVADALIDFMLALPGNEEVQSVNALVAETNDGYLNDIRGRHVSRDDVLNAIKNAKGGPVEEGCVGAGTGTVAFGFKGGIGSASRQLPEKLGVIRLASWYKPTLVGCSRSTARRLAANSGVTILRRS